MHGPDLLSLSHLLFGPAYLSSSQAWPSPAGFADFTPAGFPLPFARVPDLMITNIM